MVDVGTRAEGLIRRLAACERLLDRAALFETFGQAVSLYAAGERAAIEAEVETLAVEVFVALLSRVLGDGRSAAGVRDDARALAERKLASATGDGGRLMGLVRDLAEIHAAVDALA